jgi:tRNA(Arg) A34 adenosine deaminase TadA
MTPIAEKDLVHLRQAVGVANAAKGKGNHPFGAVLVGPDGDVLLTGENTYTTDRGPGHAETNLARDAARAYPPEFLRQCTLYTSVEPCCMCAGSIYWAGIGSVVFGITEKALASMTLDSQENLTQDLPCQQVFAAGRWQVALRGPYAEVEAEVLASHQDFWTR